MPLFASPLVSPSVTVVPLADGLRHAAEAAAHGGGLLAQHHPVWLDVLADVGEDPVGAAALRDGRLVGWMLAALREGRVGTVASSLPWVAYGGPALPAPDPDAAAALLDWYRELGRARAVAALGVALSPFATDTDVALVWRAVAAGGADVAFRFDNFAQVQPLVPHPLDQVSKRRKDALSRFVRRAERDGVEVGPCDDASVFDAWLDIYRARYTEIGARPIADEFHRAAFRRGRAAGVVEFWAAWHAGRLLGGTLFLLGAEVVDYFSSAYLMDDETRGLTPNNLLLSTAFTDLARRGKRWFNWQSSPGRDGVYRYKEGWGAEERPQLYLGRLGEDADRIRAAMPAALAADYPARFVLPFSWLRREATPGHAE
jgi:hypothetical protein